VKSCKSGVLSGLFELTGRTAEGWRQAGRHPGFLAHYSAFQMSIRNKMGVACFVSTTCGSGWVIWGLSLHRPLSPIPQPRAASAPVAGGYL
jgi:hypothetical protein